MKIRLSIFSILGLFLILLLIYRIFFFIPPLLDNNSRNFFEGVIDFFSFGWHLTKADFYEKYLKNGETAEKERGRASWYREIYLRKKFGLRDNNRNSVLDLYKKLGLLSIQEQIYKDMIKEQDQSLSFYRGYGEILLGHENWEKAAEVYKKAVDKEQSNEMDFYYLGLSYWNLGRLENARECFIEATKVLPDFADAYSRLGFIAEKNNEWEKAKNYYEKTIRILPNHLNSLKALSKIYNKMP